MSRQMVSTTKLDFWPMVDFGSQECATSASYRQTSAKNLWSIRVFAVICLILHAWRKIGASIERLSLANW